MNRTTIHRLTDEQKLENLQLIASYKQKKIERLQIEVANLEKKIQKLQGK